MARGKREGQWQVVRRCLAIVHRVQRGPASWEELVEAVLALEGADAYGGTTGRALQRRVENDLLRIRDHLLIEVYYDREAGGYVIRDTWSPLLDLPDQDLETIAWLEETFEQDSPQHDEVHALLGRLRFYLSPARRGEVERSRTALVVDLERRDEDEIPRGVWEALTKALVERRRVAFTYRSPQQADGVPRRHVVDPYGRFFDTVRGHYYLKGWCHYTDGPLGRYDQRHYFYYRMGRIAEVEVLPGKLPPFPPRARRYPVEYELAPAVARLGVTRHVQIEGAQVERRADGSALVRGETESVFWAVRTLLHYGANCRVVGGAEMVREMRRVVNEMGELYREEE
jgi:predicted DNA-binding transcriptional regulator YafY